MDARVLTLDLMEDFLLKNCCKCKIVLLKYQISFTHFLSVFAVYWVYLVRKHLPTYYVCYIRDEIIIDHLLRDIKIEIQKIENHPSQKNRQIYQIDFSIDF